MAFSEEIKIEAIKSPKVRFGEISILYSSRLGEIKLNPWRDGLHNISVPPAKTPALMADADVTVIVPVWNRRDLLVKLIERLRSQTRPLAQLLMVDNGSEDELGGCRGGGRRHGHSTGEELRIQRRSEPGNPCHTNLLGCHRERRCRACSELARRLTEAADRQSAWFATGKILSSRRPELIDGTYDAVCRGGCAWRVGNMRRDGALFSSPRPIRFVSFTAALFRTSLFAKVGLMDERFESYLEDVEFGLRCARMNFGGIYVPEALAWHEGSATLGRWHPDSVERIARNQLLLIAKHYSGSMLSRYAWHILVSQALWGLVAVRHGAGASISTGQARGPEDLSVDSRAGATCLPRLACLKFLKTASVKSIAFSERPILSPTGAYTFCSQVAQGDAAGPRDCDRDL